MLFMLLVFRPVGGQGDRVSRVTLHTRDTEIFPYWQLLPLLQNLGGMTWAGFSPTHTLPTYMRNLGVPTHNQKITYTYTPT